MHEGSPERVRFLDPGLFLVDLDEFFFHQDGDGSGSEFRILTFSQTMIYGCRPRFQSSASSRGRSVRTAALQQNSSLAPSKGFIVRN